MNVSSPLKAVPLALTLSLLLGAHSPQTVRAADKPFPIALGSQANYGVVYYIPGDEVNDEVVLQQLQAIQSQGYRHINMSSWVWTIPTPGSKLRQRVDLILNWCDRHEMGVWLLHNMQYGTSEQGDFEEAVIDPTGYAKPVVKDWIETLRGHACVQGVQLGNEVSAAIPTNAVKVPLYVRAFAIWLKTQYESVETMNAAWGSHFASFETVGLPTENAPGRIDLQRFAKVQFGNFYGTIFRNLFKPALGPNLSYTTKTSPDPYLYRAFPDATALGWDDLLANHPLWTLRVLADCDSRLPINNEIHLYHDGYQYFPSKELTRYRYFTDALSGQTMNSSFAWGAWNKPEIAAIHAATPEVLADCQRLEPQFQQFDQQRRGARLGVLVTEPLLEESGRNITARPVLKENDGPAANAALTSTSRESVPLEDAYTALGTTGRPWRYVLDADLSHQASLLDTLIVSTSRCIPLRTIEALLKLPASVRVEWAGEWPEQTEYGQPLPADVLQKLRRRCHQHPNLAAAVKSLVDPQLPSLYQEAAIVPMMWWSPDRGHFSFGVSYPKVEALHLQAKSGGEWVALINHTRENVSIGNLTVLPWVTKKQRVWDVTRSVPVELTPQSSSLILTPLDVRFFRVGKK